MRDVAPKILADNSVARRSCIDIQQLMTEVVKGGHIRHTLIIAEET